MPNEPLSYDEILIPTDGSHRAEEAVDHGLELADQADATVHSMYVVDERRYGETPALSSYELAFEQFEETGQDITEDVAQRARDANLDASTEVTRGLPHEEIVRYADEQDIDLIVMGRSGAGGAEAPHMGSVADRVLRTADVPVFPV
ncbi:MAG: nucleotide-binding universal stress UspA family protein [Natronomonas sp.]|jgi:nucleotide-binding universal stress UspA family protein